MGTISTKQWCCHCNSISHDSSDCTRYDRENIFRFRSIVKRDNIEKYVKIVNPKRLDKSRKIFLTRSLLILIIISPRVAVKMRLPENYVELRKFLLLKNLLFDQISDKKLPLWNWNEYNNFLLFYEHIKMLYRR